jgi:DNA polymerase elongation subunit (family B)
MNRSSVSGVLAGDPVKILTVDIETAPHLGYVWSLWQQNVGLSQIAEVGTVICWAAKWHGTNRVMFASDHHDGHADMLAKIWKLYDEADAVVTYNGRSFDNKHLRREWVLAGMTNPSPHKDIDLLNVVRKQFKFASSKLDHVAQQLGLGAKVKHPGFDLWLRCMADDPKSWRLMRSYNIGDVKLTEKLYDRLLPWIDSHPNRALYDDAVKGGCPRCGSADYIVRGYRVTSVARYRRYQCNLCRGYFAGTHRTDGVHAVAV